MSVHVTPGRLIGLGLVAILALSGCSGKDDDGGSTTADLTPGPLDEYMARIYGYSLDPEEQSQDQMQAEADQQGRQVEELVATCMQEQGFDYTPNDNSGGTVYASSSDDLDVEWGSKEFAEKYGYAISTDPWGFNEQQDPETDGEATEYVDPNQEYVESMSESEQVAYQEALWGPSIEYVEGEEPAEVPMEDMGCYGAAQSEVYNNGGTPEQFTALEDEINNMWQSMETNSEVTALYAAWSSCMADAGYTGLTDVNNATSGLYEEWNEIQGWNDPDYLALQEGWDWEANPDGPPAPVVDEAATSAFTDKEIAMAVADWTCQDSIDYQTTYQEIYRAMQEDFVDQHRADLEAWATLAESAGTK